MVTGLFDGNSSATSTTTVDEYTAANNNNSKSHCQVDTKRFLDCMSQNYDDVAACQSYLDMMRQCQQQFASQ